MRYYADILAGFKDSLANEQGITRGRGKLAAPDHGSKWVAREPGVPYLRVDDVRSTCECRYCLQISSPTKLLSDLLRG